MHWLSQTAGVAELSSASGAGFYNFPPSAHYDLIVIGSGPAAQKCAIDSVKRGNRVAMIDKNSQIGGACVHTGTIPSKTFREAVLHLTGYRHQGFYGKSAFMSSRRASMNEILQRVQKVEDMEAEVVRHQMRRNGVHLVTGTARFVEHGPNEKHIKLAVLLTDPEQERKGIYKHRDASLPKTLLTAEKVMVACGTRPVRQEGTIFDGKRVFDSDQLLWGGIDRVPRSFIVVGAGVIGIEYASMINVLPGTNVTIIDPRSQLLGFADREVVDALQYSMRHYGARFIMGENVEKIETLPDRAVVHLASGKRIAAEGVLYAMGRQGNTDTLNIDAAGITSDKRGLLEVNSVYQTTNPNIYAAGDCIGYPALASTSMEQGRRASCHMWGDYESIPEHSTAEDHGEAVKSVLQQGGFLGRDTEQLFPYGIYTIPEISMIGKTEEQLTAEKIPYEVGLANYKELAKGQMLGGWTAF
ncbi:soluble pyridine nucleotide transhydrogenase [Nannochloropsis oceanica]